MQQKEACLDVLEELREELDGQEQEILNEAHYIVQIYSDE